MLVDDEQISTKTSYDEPQIELHNTRWCKK